MANKLSLLKKDLFTVIKLNPVELLLGLTFFILAIFDESNHTRFIDSRHILLLFPFLLFISFIANRTLKTFPLRRLYFISYAFFVPFLFIPIYEFINSSGYFYTHLITAILFVSYRFYKDNTDFSREALRNAQNFLSAIFIALAFYLIVIGIYYSWVYIFDIRNNSNFYLYTFYFATFLISPLGLLYFDKFTENKRYKASSLSKILLNFIISPALIIYTAILYLYFAKILIVKELPRGGVAYMVFGFILFVIIGKICQELLTKRIYDWFYNRFSIISLPLICMFWVGVWYRINEYGITENRIYLVIAGIVITLFAVLFLSSRTAHYVYVSTTAIILFSIFTFIPWISASHLDYKYREDRSGYHKYSTSYYTNSLRFYDDWFYDYEGYIDISGYNKLYKYKSYNTDLIINGKKYIYEFNDETGLLFSTHKNDTLFCIDMNQKLQEMADKHGIKLTKRNEEKYIESYVKEDVMTLKTDEAIIKLNTCILRYENDSIYKVDEVLIDFLMLK